MSGMGFKAEIEVFNVNTDGPPDMSNKDNVGRVAFIWDGHIISGWPEDSPADPEEAVWSSADDHFGGQFVGVQFWVLAPSPHWKFIED